MLSSSVFEKILLFARWPFETLNSSQQETEHFQQIPLQELKNVLKLKLLHFWINLFFKIFHDISLKDSLWQHLGSRWLNLYYIILYYIIKFCIVLYSIVLCCVVLCCVVLCCVVSCHVMSCHVMSCHVMSCHVMSCHVMSCHVMTCKQGFKNV